MSRMRTRRPNVRTARPQAAWKVAVVCLLSWGLLTCNLWTARAGGPRAEVEGAEVERAEAVAEAAPAGAADVAPEGPDSAAGARAAVVSPALQVPPDALMVVGTTTLSEGDAAVKLRLEALGYTVTLKDGASAAGADAAGKEVVYIAQSVDSNNVTTKFRDVTVPVIVTEPALFKDMGMTGPVSEVDWANTMNQTNLVIEDPTHPLAAGMKGEVTVTTSPRHFAWGRPNANAERVARLRNEESHFGVFGFERGATMLTLDAPARRVGLFLFETTPPALNNNGWALFDAAVNWVTNSVLLVVGSGSLNAGDDAIRSRLEALGYKVKVKDGATLATAEAFGINLVFVS